MKTRVKCPYRQVVAAEGTEATAPPVVMASGDRAVEEAVEAWVAEWAGRSPE
jgi:hypothetical protein